MDSMTLLISIIENEKLSSSFPKEVLETGRMLCYLKSDGYNFN